jgi:acetyl-CoA carboxylase carboxyltransferase component
MVNAPMAGLVVDLMVIEGERVAQGQVLLVLEAMKMEHEVRAPFAGRVQNIRIASGAMVDEGQSLVDVAPEVVAAVVDGDSAVRLEKPLLLPSELMDVAHRTDLREVLDRHAFIADEARPDAFAKRHSLGMRSARENIADLCDAVGQEAAPNFIEYGALAFAAQTNRRSRDELIAQTPADGIVTGVGVIAGKRCAILAYDMTVLAGTQGMRSHQKTDRLLEVALSNRWPVVLFAEGGGGRPGDTDMPIIAGLNVATFSTFAKLSGQVPIIGIVAGRCFAGNAALLGCCDVIIATKNSNIGMGGPAMVEGGGLGVFTPEAIGPSDVQFANSVIDILVDDETQAVVAAKQYLAFSLASKSQTIRFADQNKLRSVVPENRLRSYSVREVIETMFDAESVLELQAGYGMGVVTAFARLDGVCIAVTANNPFHLGGAIDADAADKLAQFLELANRYRLPIVSLVDTPGFMVGPEIEAKAQVRYASQLFISAAKLTVPLFAVVLRKGYGLGAMAMTAGGFHQTTATIAWPTAEFGAMGLEGSVRLGYRKELGAKAQGHEREALFDQLLAKQYAQGKAIRMAETLEIDAVIDPAHTRQWLGVLLSESKISESKTHPA